MKGIMMSMEELFDMSSVTRLGKTAVVTGATGCVGHAVIKALINDPNASWHIHIITRPTSNLQKIKDVLPNVQVGWPTHYVDVVFHCAGNTSHDPNDEIAIYRDNVDFTIEMIHKANQLKVGKFIFTSTAATEMYPNPHYSPDIANPYAHSKALAERVVKTFPDYIIIQPCIVLGPNDHRNYAKLFDLAKQGKIIGALPGGIEFGHVDDVAEAHVNAFWHGNVGDTYMLGGIKASWKSFFEMIHCAVGKPRKMRVIPKWMLKIYCWWLRVKSWCFGGYPILTSGVVELLAKDARVPVVEFLKSRREIQYETSMTLEEMVQSVYRWKESLNEAA